MQVREGLPARHKETAMIIELGKITLQTRGGGMTFREAYQNQCLITKVDLLNESC
jgi:hypothetical protein